MFRTIEEANRMAMEHDKLAIWAVSRGIGWHEGHPEWQDAVQFCRWRLVVLARMWNPARGPWKKFAPVPMLQAARRYLARHYQHGFVGVSRIDGRRRDLPRDGRVRGHDRERSVILQSRHVVESSDREMDLETLRGAVRKAIRKLPRELRSSVVGSIMKHPSRWSYAKASNIPRTTNEGRVRRGLDILREVMVDMDV